MVFYKRKAVEFVPVSEALIASANPARKSAGSRSSLGRNAEEETQCWELKETGELFATYDEYLARRDFYMRKVFTCEISGRSALDFFEALDSEINGSKEIQDAFPESLRQPVLREVHHRVEQRLEQLVNIVHDKYKDDFFPGEQIQVIRAGGEVSEGKIREKIILGGDTPRYTVSLLKAGEFDPEDMQVEGDSMRRDRRTFNKQLLRTFLKDCLSKEPWHGSPWCVKPALAQALGLSTQVPEHLRHSVVAERRKQDAFQKRAQQQQLKDANKSMGVITDFRQYPGSKKNGQVPYVPSGPGIMQPVWSSKPGGKHKNKFVANHHKSNGTNGQLLVNTNGAAHSQYASSSIDEPQPLISPSEGILIPPGGMVFQRIPTHVRTREDEPSPPPVLRYPFDDLDIPYSSERPTRPKLKDFTQIGQSEGEDEAQNPAGSYLPTAVGPLLEVWNTLNVHNEVYVLDSFTFDDFAQAVRYSNSDIDCELFAETHCSILKLFVGEDGKLLVDMPKLEDDQDDESDSSSEEESEGSGAEQTPEPQPLKRSTRSSLRKDDLNTSVKERSPTPNPFANRGEEYQANHPWQERCKNRDFAHNAWQGAVAGFLYQLSLSPVHKERCDRILCKLLPEDEEPIDETIVANYKTLDVNLRLSALEIMTKKTITTLALREHLDRMAQEMTELRKKKIDQQRIRRDLADELATLKTQRLALMADIEDKKSPEERVREAEEAAAQLTAEQDDASMQDLNSVNGNNSDSDSSSEARRMLRKRKRTETISIRNRPKPKLAKVKLSKEQIALVKLDDEILKRKDAIKNCEDTVDDITSDLRETDCQRTRCLGKDRYCNRYWWYERNGMPYGGVPSSSTADYGYANARLWIQGPYQHDVDDMFNLTRDQSALYRSTHGISVKERRAREEGGTSLANAEHFGYIETLEELEQLIEWLDERGDRERALKKELVSWREMMGECMSKLGKHQRSSEDKQLDDAEAGKPILRVSTRTKNYVDLGATGWQCLRWQNTMALDLHGQKHSETSKRRGGAVAARGVAHKKAQPADVLVDKKQPTKKATERKVSVRGKTATVEHRPEPASAPLGKRMSSRLVKAEPAVVVEVSRAGRPTRRR